MSNLLIAVLVLLSFLPAHATGSFLRPESTIVLLNGLPGDLESESTYRDQLQSWLQILAEIHPHKIITLADNPENVVLPRNDTATHWDLLSASRSNFLAVASLIAGTTNPLIVVIWGHGGKQGNTPVFHVRGPRITPGDILEFADKAGAVESEWILCFRGSASFASKLEGNGRQILSSESDTMFNSDPVEMFPLLKSLHENHQIPFGLLADTVGRATAEWYKERNLARTEEPTLWLPNQKPKLLAAAFEENTLASLESAPTTATNGLSKEITNSTASANISGTNLPPAWKDLKHVEPQDYSDSDAVILRRRISYVLAESPAVVADHDEFIQILTPEGKRFGDFDISYSAPAEDITFSDCEVLSPQGILTRLNPDAIREANDESLGDYHAGRRKFFSLPGVVPGSILHVNYRNEWKKFPFPRISLEIPISSELPEIESTVQVTVPKNEPFHFALENGSGTLAADGTPGNVDPAIKQTGYGTTYIWQITNLLAESRDILAPPKQGLSLMVSTFSDWSEFAHWYARISQFTDEITPEIRAKAGELARNSITAREKILSIYNYVTSLRYVAIPLGVNSFRPHAASNVFKNQFGDCKDKANLFNTMLRSLNIDANLVLVPRFRQAYDELPGLAFNHAISRVVLPDEILWVDTTDDVCRFGMLPPGDSGRRVLVIAEQTNSLTQLPPPDPGRHKLTIKAQIDCSEWPSAMPVKFDVNASGYPDYEMREVARDVKEHAGSVAFLSARYRLTAGLFALERQDATPLAALDRDFNWKAQGKCVGICQTIPSSQSTNRALQQSIRPPFWLPKEWELALNRRQSALFLNQGYPLTLDEELEFTLPIRSRIAGLPAVTNVNKGAIKWRLEWANSDDAKVNVNLHVELPSGEVSKAQVPAFQEQLRNLISALNVGIAFELPNP